jgi:hypothetical protein
MQFSRYRSLREMQLSSLHRSAALMKRSVVAAKLKVGVEIFVLVPIDALGAGVVIGRIHVHGGAPLLGFRRGLGESGRRNDGAESDEAKDLIHLNFSIFEMLSRICIFVLNHHQAVISRTPRVRLADEQDIGI